MPSGKNPGLWKKHQAARLSSQGQHLSPSPSLPPTPLGKLRDEQQEAVIPEEIAAERGSQPSSQEVVNKWAWVRRGGWAGALVVLTGAFGAALPRVVAVAAAFVYSSRGCRGGSDTPWGGGTHVG